MDSDFTYFFLHISKTGGTTFTKHITGNLKKEEYIELSSQSLGLADEVNNYKRIESAAYTYIEKMSKERLKKVKFVYGHLLPYGLHKFFPKKPRYITIVRNPVERVVSNYNYLLKLYSKEDKKNPAKMYKDYLLVDGVVPSFADWISKKYNLSNIGIGNRPITKVLEINGFLTKKRENVWNKFYFVAITENLKKDLPFMLSLFPLSKYFINQNLAPRFFKPGKKYIRSLRRTFATDYVLYKKAILYNLEFVKNNPEYKTRVLVQTVKRTAKLPLAPLYDLQGIMDSVKTKMQ